MRPSSLVLPLLLSLVGCVYPATPPVGPDKRVPPDTAAVCASHCNSLGMDLGAVVIVRDSAGCVCQPRKAPASPSSASSAVMSAIVAVMDAEEREEASRQARQRSDEARRRSDEERRRREDTRQRQERSRTY